MGAKVEFLKTGGNAKDYELKKKEAAQEQVKSVRKSCMDKNDDVKALASDATNDQKMAAYKAARKSCDSEVQEAYKAAGGSLNNMDFEKDREEAEAKEIMSDIAACVENAKDVTDMKAKTSVTADEKFAAYRKAQVACNEDAENALLKRGIDTSKLGQKRQEGARENAKEGMKGCVETKLKESGKTKATADDYKTFQIACTDEAKEQFAKAGGSIETFDKQIKEAATKEARKKSTSCVDNHDAVTALASDATKDQKITAYKFASKACAEESKNTFMAYGGKGEEFSLEKQQEEGVKEDMQACMKNNADVKAERAKTGFDMKSTAAKDAFKKAQKACNAEVEENFLKTGGDVKELAQKKRVAQKGAVEGALRNCVSDKVQLFKGKNNGTAPSNDKMKTYQKECDSVAQEKLTESGGNIEEYKKIKEEAATKAGGDTFSACMGKNVDAAKLKTAKDAKDSKAMQAEYQKASATCRTESMQAFKEAGGSVDDDLAYQKQMDMAKADKLKDALKTCVKETDAVKTAEAEAGTDRAALQKAYRDATKACDSKAEDEFLKAGGDVKEFAMKKKEGQENTLKDAMIACMKEQKLNAAGKIDGTKLKEFQEDCDKEAETEFARAGGDVEDFEVAKKAAARTNAADDVKACMETNMEGKDVTTSEKKYAAYKNARIACESKGEEAFKEAGGKVEKDATVGANLAYKKEMEVAQGNKVRDTLRSCVPNDADVIAAREKVTLAGGDKTKLKTAHTELQNAYKTANKKCGADAETEFLKTGGDPKELALTKKRAKITTVKDAMVGCVKQKALDADVKSSDNDYDTKMEGFQKLCSANAKDEFLASGGDAEEYKVAVKEAARNEASDKMETCVEKSDAVKALAAHATSDKKAEAYKTAAALCSSESKKSFLVSGGKAEEFEVEAKKAQTKQVANTMGACMKSLHADTATERDAWKKAMDDCYTASKATTTREKRKECYESQAVQTARAALAKVYKAVKKNCTESTKTAYLKAGGDASTFVKEKKKAAVTGLKSSLSSCVSEKVLNDYTTAKPTAAQYKEIVAGCEGEAEEKFQEAGGKPEQFKEAKVKAARAQLQEKGSACIEEYLEEEGYRRVKI